MQDLLLILSAVALVASHLLYARARRAVMRSHEQQIQDLRRRESQLLSVQQELRSRIDLVRSVGDNVPGSCLFRLVLSQEGKVYWEYVSNGAVTLLGVPLERLKEDPASFLDAVEPASDRERLELLFREAAKSLADMDTQFHAVRTDGASVWIRVQGRPRKDGDNRVVMEGLASDITAHRRIEMEMERRQELLEITNQQLHDAHERLVATHQRMVDSEGRFRTVFEHSPAGIFRCDASGRILLANRKMGEILGIPGLEDGDLAERSVVITAAGFLTFLEQVLAHHQVQGFEFHHERPDGSRCWLRASGVLVQEFTATGQWIEGSLEDVSAHHMVEEQLRESERRYRILLERAPMPILVHRVGTILFCNQQADLLLGGSDDDRVSGKKIAEIIHPESLAELDRLLLLRKDDPESVRSGSSSLNDANGRRIWIETFGVEIPWEGGSASLVVVLDVTHRVESGRRLLQAMRNESFSVLAAGVSHEIRQPLSLIMMTGAALEVSLEDGYLMGKDEQLARYRSIQSEAARIKGVVEHLRELIHVESEGVPSHLDPLPIVRRALSLAKSRMAAHGILFEDALPKALPEAACHELQLEHIILNLFHHAVSELDRSSQERRIHFSAAVHDGMVELFLDRTGAKFPDNSEEMFDIFREDHSVGLPVAREFLKQWGGALAAEMLPDGRSRYRLTLLC